MTRRLAADVFRRLRSRRQPAPPAVSSKTLEISFRRDCDAIADCDRLSRLGRRSDFEAAASPPQDVADLGIGRVNVGVSQYRQYVGTGRSRKGFIPSRLSSSRRRIGRS